jgi:hypothetical protein
MIVQIDDSPLHTLWSKAVGTANYNKREWIALETKLHRALAVCRKAEAVMTNNEMSVPHSLTLEYCDVVRELRTVLGIEQAAQ